MKLIKPQGNYLIKEERNWDNTCMPSWPDIPIPTLAAWIILTSFAPSPGVGRQERKITMQERVPPSEEGNHISYAIISNILYYHASWSGELMRGIKALVLVSLLPRRPGSTRAKSSTGTSWVVTQQSQHHLHQHHFVFLLGQIHMLRNMFCNTLFHWILWIYDKFDCRWQRNKPVSRIILLISTCSNMLNM